LGYMRWDPILKLEGKDNRAVAAHIFTGKKKVATRREEGRNKQESLEKLFENMKVNFEVLITSVSWFKSVAISTKIEVLNSLLMYHNNFEVYFINNNRGKWILKFDKFCFSIQKSYDVGVETLLLL